MKMVLVVMMLLVLCPSVMAHGLRVGLILPGSISDAGWNALAYNGLQLVKSDLGATVRHIESRNPTDWISHISWFGNAGYDVVFAHGFEFQEICHELSHRYPDTTFIVTGGSIQSENLTSLIFELEEATFMLGVIAGSMTKTNKIGMVGGMSIPPLNSTFYAFEQGAKSVNPSVMTIRSYVGDWENIGKAKELALAQLAEGCDFILQNADSAGKGVFHAVEQHVKRNGDPVYALGTYLDQSDLAPTVILASAVVDPQVFVYAIRDPLMLLPMMPPRLAKLKMGMAVDGSIKLVYNKQLVDRIPVAIQKRIAKLRQRVLKGDWSAPRKKGNY